MTQLKPPALASWMLRHLVLGDQTEALEGDLLEEFQRRGSVAWYWRQVFGAIFASFTNEVRADWVMVWTVLFTLAWTYCLYAIPIVGWPVPMPILFRLNHFLEAHGYYGTFIWYASGRLFMHGIPFLFHVAAPLGIYLLAARNFRLRTFTMGLCAAVLVSIVLVPVPFQPALDFLSMHGLAMYWVQLWKWFEVVTRILPLLAAIWVAQAGRKRSLPTLIPGC